MMREGGAPGMQDRDDADASAQVLGVGCDCECGLGRCFHEQVIDHGLVLIGDVAELGGQGVNDMKIFDRQQFGLALSEPPAGGGALTIWAVAGGAKIFWGGWGGGRPAFSPRRGWA